MNHIIPTKKEWRQTLRRARQNLPRETRQRATRASNLALKSLIKRGKNIAVYIPIGSEMRLDEFVRSARQRGANVYVPYIEPRQLRLWFTPYPTDAIAERPRGSGSLKVPQFSGNRIRAHRLHLMILPIVGVDKRGYRLGQGGGYYDATLSVKRHVLQPRKVAVGFACQQVDDLPHEPHDCRVDEWVCESGRINITTIEQ